MLKDGANNTQVTIFIIVTLLILGSIIFHSGSQIDFYTKLISTLLIVIITFINYCISDYFWFLKLKQYKYTIMIANTEFIKELSSKTDENLMDRKLTYQEQILSVTNYYNKEIKRITYRYLGEIIVLLILSFYVNEFLFYFNLAVFIGMFVYDALYANELITQAFNDVKLIINCIKEFNKNDPEICKRFILNNKKPEVRTLREIYKYVSESEII